MNHLIAPSILTADFTRLGETLDMLNNSQADWIHLDIMDGVFVPNITFGFPVIRAIRERTSKFLDVHLMIVQPERYIREFKNAGADLLCIHYEASTHLHRSVQKIKELGMKAGVALNPHTPIDTLQDILHDLDMVLVMSVNPGFGGQKFITQTFSKISRLKQMIDQQELPTLIQVDGGVDLKNTRSLVEAGVNVLVAGNTVFAAPDPVDTIRRLKQLDV